MVARIILLIQICGEGAVSSPGRLVVYTDGSHRSGEYRLRFVPALVPFQANYYMLRFSDGNGGFGAYFAADSTPSVVLTGYKLR